MCSSNLRWVGHALSTQALLQFANVFNLQAAMPNGVLDTMSLKLVPGIKVSLDSLHVNDLKSQELHVSGLEKALKKLQVSWSGTQKKIDEHDEKGNGQSKGREQSRAREKKSSAYIPFPFGFLFLYFVSLLVRCFKDVRA